MNQVQYRNPHEKARPDQPGFLHSADAYWAVFSLTTSPEMVVV